MGRNNMGTSKAWFSACGLARPSSVHVAPSLKRQIPILHPFYANETTRRVSTNFHPKHLVIVDAPNLTKGKGIARYGHENIASSRGRQQASPDRRHRVAPGRRQTL